MVSTFKNLLTFSKTRSQSSSNGICRDTDSIGTRVNHTWFGESKGDLVTCLFKYICCVLRMTIDFPIHLYKTDHFKALYEIPKSSTTIINHFIDSFFTIENMIIGSSSKC